ncbi:MAG: hypothetical protein K9L02_03865 [Acholeplasmataceae bacterium]|nr:hypothetical protein [Acholeplasmataceae bacterium]
MVIYVDQDIINNLFEKSGVQCPFNIKRDVKEHLKNKEKPYIDELSAIIEKRVFKKPLFTCRKGDYNGKISIQKIEIKNPANKKGKSRGFRFVVLIDYSTDESVLLTIFAKGKNCPNTKDNGSDLDDDTMNKLKRVFDNYIRIREI